MRAYSSLTSGLNYLAPQYASRLYSVVLIYYRYIKNLSSVLPVDNFACV